MGMSCIIWQVVPETIKDMLDDPTLGDDVLTELKEYNEELPDEEKICLDLDKSWDGINFLLSKKERDPLSGFIKTGGQDIGAIDEGYGLARYFTPEETAKLNSIIKKNTFADLCRGVQASELAAADVYLFHSGSQQEQEFGFLEENWIALVKFVDAAVMRKRGIMTYIF